MTTEASLTALITRTDALLDLLESRTAGWQAQVDALTSSLHRTVFVDSEQGDDARSGLTQALSVRTLARAAALSPIGGQAVWLLAPRSTPYQHNVVADLARRSVRIQPVTIPPGTTAADRALMPLIRFGARPSDDPFSSGGFSGGHITAAYVRIETAPPSPGSLYEIEGCFAGHHNHGLAEVNLLFSDLTLREQTLCTMAAASAGVLMVHGCRIFETGAGRQGRLFTSATLAPSLITVESTTLPANRTVKQMVGLAGAVDAGGKPLGLLTNLTW